MQSSGDLIVEVTTNNSNWTVAAVALPPQSKSSALLQYEAEMKPSVQNMALAQAASICGLRSNAWSRVITLGSREFQINEATQLHLSPAEKQAATQDMTELYWATFPSLLSRKACDLLRNSPTVDMLDEVERKLTGNYH
jgi:hypothetical protein